ncbi:phage tail protein [Streptomyces sp. H27-C3]|uniref:phage tail protein n=1 Tax=Streptomyces sp. H27-C3 TaxID=3046305 RepID=UPI0024B9DE55|nr:phage tail protein [Streptomyces sp. H27-C3]MDJ0466203.1 phage tail protein [Streptomyces sp. H27-C3]
MDAHRPSGHPGELASPPSPALPPLVPGSRSLRALLPESYRQGDFVDRFIAGFDDTLAPVITALDCLGAHLSARTAPDDFLTWMLRWSDTELPACVGTTGRRNALLLGRRLHGLRGTRAGLELLVRDVLGARLEISESGTTHYSHGPEEHPAPEGGARVRIRVLLPYGSTARAGVAEDLEDLVREWVPVHVTASVAVLDDVDPLSAAPSGSGR